MKHKSKVRLGFSEFSKKLYADTKNKILNELNADENDWKNPKWQLKNRISDVDEILKYVNLSDEEYENITTALQMIFTQYDLIRVNGKPYSPYRDPFVDK